MITIRKSRDRGTENHGWLLAKHTFSFADYHDPQHMGFSVLRVINEDRVVPGAGFPPHPHRDMEIITYVLEGAIAHQDSTGGRGVIRPGDVQHMSAGRGVVHSELNASKTEPLHLLQIWILPKERGIEPRYDQKHYPVDDRRGRLRIVASPDGRDGSLPIHQDASLYATVLDGERVTHTLAPGRKGWLQVARGDVTINGAELGQGDGAAIVDETELTIGGKGEALLFDLPA
jgi:hypothetical protein